MPFIMNGNGIEAKKRSNSNCKKKNKQPPAFDQMVSAVVLIVSPNLDNFFHMYMDNVLI